MLMLHLLLVFQMHQFLASTFITRTFCKLESRRALTMREQYFIHSTFRVMGEFYCRPWRASHRKLHFPSHILFSSSPEKSKRVLRLYRENGKDNGNYYSILSFPLNPSSVLSFLLFFQVPQSLAFSTLIQPSAEISGWE